jgi:transcriptional regulator with PAS, ATPase and Fis domain
MKRRRRRMYATLVHDYKRDIIRIAVRIEADTKKAAKPLGISRSTLYRLRGDYA